MANPRTLEILERLIAFPTVSHDSNLDLIDWVQALLDGAGFVTTRIASAQADKAGLFALIGPEKGPENGPESEPGNGGVCLSAHSDVVPVSGQPWTRPPFTLSRDGARVYGRGTTDMKGFLASALAMAETAHSHGLRAPLSLCLSYDEEVGCQGIREMLPALGPLIGRPDVVIVGEPTGMQVALGHKGKTAFELTCHGEAGHSALAPRFTNAIHVATDLIGALRDWQNALAAGPQDPAYEVPFSTVHVGKITGGQALNMVPEMASLSVEVRSLPHIAPAEVAQTLAQICAEISARHPAVPPISLTEIATYPGLDTAPDAPVARWAARLGTTPGDPQAVTGPPGHTKVAFGTEAGFFAQLGLPTVVIGPGEMSRDGHKPDEGLSLQQLAACDAMMARILESLRG